METLRIEWSSSKQQVLEEKLTGFWAKDEWNIVDCPLFKDEKSRRKQSVVFNCVSSSLQSEIKYACWQKLENKEWSVNSFWIQAVRIKNIINWLNTVAPNEVSLVNKSLEHWLLSLRSFLAQHKKLREYTTERLDSNQELTVYFIEDKTIICFRQIYKIIINEYDNREEYDKEVWDIRKLGIEANPSKSEYRLNFENITQPWLLEAVKKFIRYSLSICSFGESGGRLHILRDFSIFIAHYHPSLRPEDIDRPLVLEYINQLAGTGLAPGTRCRHISCLRTFFELCTREGWAAIPDKKFVYADDFPRGTKKLPRYIPEDVLAQLNQHIEELPPHHMRIVLILQECGMRVGELCKMRFDCLRQDVHGDWFLHYYQFKMKKDHTIPISREIVAVIQEQQQFVIEQWGENFPYLFPVPKPYGKGSPVKQNNVAHILNRLGKKNNIRDANGKLWRFYPHQFRHTVGTRMVNNGVPQHIIQRYLGHESPEMTARYAFIHDQTLKEEFAKFRGKVVNVMGRVVEPDNISSNDSPDLEWLKKNILTQALPNGTCALPVVAGSCPHANACLTCTHFRTTKEFLDEHKKQLEQTNHIIETAQTNGWQRQVEMNEKVKENLERIIVTLEE
ncbi:tyrosine-type recombinase/integrase [Scytonema sp. NUACC26]|uniref:tyrosine-type recombinase/integrase n=1 Tax=Scytonema sp. NUACC26 TaxID=3140176 RepID=UPI0034DBA7FD